MDSETARIVIVDDDPSVLAALAKQIALMGHEVTPFEDPALALQHLRQSRGDCLILDLNMPELTGLEVQEELADLRVPVGIIFVSGAATVQSSVSAMRGGATHFLEKPIEYDDLSAAVDEALAKVRNARRETEAKADAERRYHNLTERQQAVFREILTGAPNKVIAHRLNIGERTVKAHRQAHRREA